LGGRPARLRPNSGRAGGGAGRGRGRGGPLGRLGAYGCRDLGAEAAGEAARRQWPALAAVAGISTRPWRIRATCDGEGFHGVSGRCRVAGTSTEWREKRRSPSSPHGSRRSAWSSGGSVRRGRRSRRLPFYGRHAHALATARSPRLNSSYGASSTGACREPGGGPVDKPEREGRRGQGLHMAGHGLQRPSECSPSRAAWSRDGARGP
jgi:hypothetical protein